MGVQLEGFYDKAKEKGGIPGQVKMAMITGMTRKDAAAAVDTPENVKTFTEALAKV